MITTKKIKQLSNNAGFWPNTLPVERDFLLNIIMYELYQLDIWKLLVFKWWTALKKVFFWRKFDSYRFSKDLDFNIIKDISINRIEDFIDDLLLILEDKYNLRFTRIWWVWEWDYGEKSYAIKIILEHRLFVFNENVRIKFDFAIRPWFDKSYSEYKIANHYSEFFDEDIYCLCEDIDVILYDKFLALVWPMYRTEPKDFFDIISLINTRLISDDKIYEIINKFNPILNEERVNTIYSHWNSFFEDQLSYIPDIEKYMKQYDYIVNKYYDPVK